MIFRILYFAYGANLCKNHMSNACPDSYPVAPCILQKHKFIINRDGWATVIPDENHNVHGVLWSLSAECEKSLDIQEDIKNALYSKHIINVDNNGKQYSAMIYIGRSAETGIPNPGYLENIIESAQNWQLPIFYREHLSLFLS